jgi:hypothetical protein
MAKKKKINNPLVITAICCLTAIELFAMYNGHNGTLRMLIIAAICGLAGYVLPPPK